MKKINQLIVSLLLTGLFFAASSVCAQTPVSKITLENERVKVATVEFKPGDFAPTHSHPNNVVYIISGGKMEFTDQGKQPMVFDLKDGESIWMPAVIHTAKNIGDTTVKMLVVELKPETPKK